MSNSNYNDTSQQSYFHAVGPGKQFPPRFRGKPDMLIAEQNSEQITDDFNSREEEEEEEEEEIPLEESLPDLPTSSLPVTQQSRIKIEALWKVHDAADQMLNDRRTMVARTTQQGGGSSKVSSKMMLSSQWHNVNMEEMYDIISLNLSEVTIIHQTFRIAAMTVLDAMQQQAETSSVTTTSTTTTIIESDRQKHDTSMNQNSHMDDETTTTWWDNLPESLRRLNPITSNDGTIMIVPPPTRTSLSSIRAYCMERSYENKEYTKRKGGKTEILTRPNKKAKLTHKEIGPQQQQPSSTPTITSMMNKDRNTQSTAEISDVDVVISSSTMELTPVKSSNSVVAIPIHQSTLELPAVTFDHTISTATTPTKSRPTTTVYTTHAILRTAGDFVLEHYTTPESLNTTDSQNDLQTEEMIDTNDILTRAHVLAKRSLATIESALRRNNMRYQYRMMNALYDNDKDDNNIFSIFYDHPFSYTRRNQPLDGNRMDTETNDSDQEEIVYQPNSDSITDEWESYCRPHLLSILHSNRCVGNAIYIDVQWTTRHGRIANLLSSQQQQQQQQHQKIYNSSILDDDHPPMKNYGPHLIVATENEIARFAQEFYQWNDCARMLTNDTTGHSNSNDDGTKDNLYALTYRGSKQERRTMRQLLFAHANGTRNASFHVLITSYDDFLEDMLHFYQIPFDTVILDDGVAWMGAKEPNSTLGLIWNSALFSTNDQYNGLAGTTNKEWDFSKHDIPETALKEAWIGLTARHRIATGSTMAIPNGQSTDTIPVSNLLEFLTPQFFNDIKEDWDKSKVLNDKITLDHFRKLLSRFITVYCDESPNYDMLDLAQKTLFGTLQSLDRVDDHLVPTMFTWDSFIESGKALQRPFLRWLGPPQTSWIRHALGKANFQHILEAMKVSQLFGPLCEAVTTSSSLTSAGATGQVSGVAAFRLAVRCGRHFGSELGLRQHLAAQHASSGTWKCRTCSIDCTTSQTRTHHEKLCGQAINVEIIPMEPLSSTDATFNTRQAGGKKVNIGKTKQNKPGPSGRSTNVKDPVSTVDHGENAENVVPALSVINIKDLPPDVKPLLRDPRQTSRTGGNSKRHIYAYRGVCRQARKGHDRWQSQISFAGVNHYLGTFDSEWDAAAIYAWAHLILYGEEATKLAQKEGEEAAAAYEQEQRDIATGKMPDPPPKSETKKKALIRKSKDTKVEGGNVFADSANAKKEVMLGAGSSGEATKKGKQPARRESLSGGSNAQSASSKQSNVDKEAMTMFLSNGVMKAPMLGPRLDLLQATDADLIAVTGKKLKSARVASYNCTFPASGTISSAEEHFRPCIPFHNTSATVIRGSKNQAINAADRLVGSAMLVGLSASSLGWDLQSFVEESVHKLRSEQDIMAALQLLAVEYDDDGVNEQFQSLMQGTVCIIGCASKMTQEMYNSLGLGSVPLGGSVGDLDCHIGGVPGSCSELAAHIRYAPNESSLSLFQLSCFSTEDVVTLNGEIITAERGDVPLFHEDICSVGARVFTFLLPK